MSAIVIAGDTSGTVTLQAPSVSGSTVLTLPNTSGDLVSATSTTTFTNKSISGSTNTLTNVPASALTGTVGATNGGTGLTSYSTGDIVYASATNTLSKLTAGTNGYVLTLAAGVPSWAAGGGGLTIGTTSISGGTTGQLLYDNAGVVGELATVPVANGGTGAATLTANAVLIGNGTSAVTTVAPGTSGNLLTSNGTTWTSTANTGVSTGKAIAMAIVFGG